jgi:hypothetical protein
LADPGGSRKVTEAARVFAAEEREFEAAFARHGLEAQYRVAGRVVALRFAGPALAAKLLPAFAHLQPASGEPADLVICSWDDTGGANSTGQLPAASEDGIDYCGGPVRLAWERGDRSLQAYDASRCLALFHVPDAARLAAWEQGAPFRRILHWWSAQQGLQLLHGAAIGNAAGGALLVGQSGSGKSTTALACAGTSLGYVADDYCLLEPGTPPCVHSIYGSGKADANAIARLPHLAAAFLASPIDQQGKSIIFLAEHLASAVLRSLPLRAVVAPKILPDTACRIDRLSRGEALRALAPSTLFQMPGDRAASLSRITALIQNLPCFRLTIGNDPAAALPFLEAVIAGTDLPA